MYIPQALLSLLQKEKAHNKVMVVYGARRTGKTTLLNAYLKGIKQKYLLVNGEDINVQHFLSSRSIQQLKDFIGDASLLVIDEAQKISDIGLNLKLIVDNIKGIRVVVTGSSTFDLARKIGEPLTGRKITWQLFPLSQMELANAENQADTRSHLDNRLIYGSYPEAVLAPSLKQKQLFLHEIVNSYLYKDILELEGIKKSKKVIQLLQLLAFQIGREVSYSELGAQLGLNKITVEKYLDLLEKVFVIVNIRGFSRNLRKEISKTSRYYFYDTGVRNALINNFNVLNLRDDTGQLWENYVILERLKKQHYKSILANNYFWRTYDQKEIDWVEERRAKLHGYEIKWGKTKTREPREWRQAYKNASYQVINRENYLKFII